MIPILILMSLGILIGYFFSHKKTFLQISDRLVTISIYLLLFLLGISVGVNEQIINNLSKIGVQAVLLSIGALAGSLILAYYTYKFFFKK